MTVTVQTQASCVHEIDLAWLSLLVETTLGDEKVEHGHVDVFLVDETEMAALNLEHMGKQGPTDVLAFPLDEASGHGQPEGDLPIHLGDLVICPTVAERQAPDHAGSIEAEMTLLAVHGVLHILGHDHAEPTETARMQERERFHLAKLGFSHPVAVTQ